MLRKLHIQNYAIIDHLDIAFESGFNVITGETGAGKSILIGAFSLILGNRADTSALRDKSKKCIIEGAFELESPALDQFLQQNDLDKEDVLTVRREISAAGKSRGFINDTPVSLAQLRTIGNILVDLHQQFDTLQLGDEGFQREVLDALAGNKSLRQEYTKIYQQWHQTSLRLRKLQAEKNAQLQEQDYLQFQYEELSDAAFSENELENIAEELEVLTHAEDIKSTLAETAYTLQEGELPMTSTLKQLANKLSNYEKVLPAIGSLAERLRSAQIELVDIADEISLLADRTNVDAERIQWINDRLATGYKLQKKHNLGSTAELLALQDELESKLNAIQHAATDEENLSSELVKYQKEAFGTAAQIHKKRSVVIDEFEQELKNLLSKVGMPNARIKIQINPTDTLNAYGTDEIEFLFDANNSQRFEPIRKVASGGELSRLMLCIKSLVSKSMQMPTLVFDEIDTGISGEAAKQVGIIMKEMSRHLQLIVITHQPQIAGKADTHYFVFKQSNADAQVTTGIKILNKEERIQAIAQMIGGADPTPAAIANAKELLK